MGQREQRAVSPRHESDASAGSQTLEELAHFNCELGPVTDPAAEKAARLPRKRPRAPEKEELSEPEQPPKRAKKEPAQSCADAARHRSSEQRCSSGAANVAFAVVPSR